METIYLSPGAYANIVHTWLPYAWVEQQPSVLLEAVQFARRISLNYARV